MGWIEEGWIEAGWIEMGEAPAEPPVTPALMEVGEPGAALHRLPYRARGGSSADLDMLYGVIGADDFCQDIQPIFAMATRQGFLRAFGFEIPRPEILALTVEAYATLLEVDDLVVEGNPQGPNLFGSVGLTTRPMSTVTISNDDGYWDRLRARELLLYAPAGLFWDIAHRVILPELVGTIGDVVFDGNRVRLTYGHIPRRHIRAPLD